MRRSTAGGLLTFILMLGFVSEINAQGSANPERLKSLEGKWQITSSSVYPWDVGEWTKITGAPGAHYRIELRGQELFLSLVVDEDSTYGLVGDEHHYAILKLNGRRVSGKLDKRWPWYKLFSGRDFFGVVSQDFTEIKISILYDRTHDNYQTMLLRHQ